MSNTAELPISFDRRRRLLKAVGESGDATSLWTGEGERIVVHVQVDLAAARRVSAAFRRIDRVELVLSGADPVEAAVYAVGHRLPVRRPVSVGAALGLARLGVPAVVEMPVRGES